MAARVVCVKHNPADPTSGLKLWGNGYIQAFGPNAIAPADWTPPEGFGDYSAQDMVVIAHGSTPSGYVLSWTGVIFTFGAVSPATGHQDTGRFHIWRKLTMNPAGNGQGYEWDVRGRAYRFGPTLPPNLPGGGSGPGNLAGGIDWGQDIFADVHLDWSTKRFMELSNRGHFNSPSFTVTWDPSDVRPLQDGRSLYRALAPVNPAIPVGDTAFYITTYTGRVFGANGAEHIRPFAVYPDQDVVTDLAVTSDGRAGRPLILELAHEAGLRRELVVSVAPTVAMAGPATTTTTTTRPSIIWDFSDPDGDAQASARVKLFTSAQYGAGGFDPDTSAALGDWTITDGGTFRLDVPFDLVNGTYRAYVKATDSAGDVSIWDFRQFVMNVVPPNAPTVGVDPDPQTWATAVTVTAGAGSTTGLSAVAEYSDDEGVTWEQVVGGTVAYPTSGPKVVTVQDHQAPFNQGRRYRGRTIAPEPYITSAASSSVTDFIPSDEWVVTDASSGEGMAVSWIPEWTDRRDSGGAAHYPLGRGTAVVTRTGMKAATMPISIRTMSRAAHDELEGLITSGRTLLLRDPHERHLFCSVVGEVERTMLDGIAPDAFEVTNMRFAHEHRFSVAVVDRPAP